MDSETVTGSYSQTEEDTDTAGDEDTDTATYFIANRTRAQRSYQHNQAELIS